MIKYTHFKLTPAQVLFSIIGIGVVLTGLLFAVYQLKYGNFSLVSKASDPCAAYPKLSPIKSAEGTVHDKTDIGFNWWENGVSTKVKVVVLCAGSKFTRQFGADIPYSDIKENDIVTMTGNFGDTTKTTILATWVRNMSTSVAGEYVSRVATVNHSQSSFTLNAVTMKVAGKYGPYTLNVKYSPTTSCYFRSKQKPFDCSNIAVGNRAAVSGIVDDNTITMNATNIVIDY